MAGYIIEVKHRNTGEVRYIASAPVEAVGENLTLEAKWCTREEASRYPYDTEEIAAHVIDTFPETENLIWSIVPADSEISQQTVN